MGTGEEVLSPVVKRPEHEADHSPKYNADIKISGIPLPIYVFMAWH
jgi:hypothetical protein